MEIPIEELGHPGWLTELHVVPQFAGQVSDDRAALTDRTPRAFEVAALLSKAPVAKSTVNFQFTAEDGSSYFLVPADAMDVATPWGGVRVEKNKAGEASLVRMTCTATSANEALATLHLACAAFLDHMSFAANAPVYIVEMRAGDPRHKMEMVRFASPFRLSTINPVMMSMPLPLRPMFALYREALNSASPLYRFLCLYKILEGYFERLKPALHKVFRDAGRDYPVPRELVPDDKDLLPELKAHVGTSMSKFRDDHLTPNYRTAVAHFEKDGDTPLISSDPDQLARFNHTGLAVELCARTVIESYQRAFQAALDAGFDLSALA